MESDLLLGQYCTQLHLSAVAANYRHFVEDAARANQPYDRFLLALLEREIQQRALNQEKRRLRSAGFPVLYTLDTFDFTAIPLHRLPDTQRIICYEHHPLHDRHLSL